MEEDAPNPATPPAVTVALLPCLDGMTEGPAPPPPITSPPAEDAEATGIFEFTDDRKFELYMQQRKGYQDGARDAYQRFDQTVVALSGGTIVLSITFLKDIGHVPWSIPWLIASWAAFLVASYSAFVSLRTSGESDRERLKQLDCSVENGVCDETEAKRLSAKTVKLNERSLRFCIAGVILILIFALQNFVVMGGGLWQKAEKEGNHEATKSSPTPPANSSKEKVPPATVSAESSKSAPTKPAVSSQPIPATQSQNH
jgi:hypothetical protein